MPSSHSQLGKTPIKTHPHEPVLAKWTTEFSSQMSCSIPKQIGYAGTRRRSSFKRKGFYEKHHEPGTTRIARLFAAFGAWLDVQLQVDAADCEQLGLYLMCQHSCI